MPSLESSPIARKEGLYVPCDRPLVNLLALTLDLRFIISRELSLVMRFPRPLGERETQQHVNPPGERPSGAVAWRN
jgi:hypothetical protein